MTNLIAPADIVRVMLVSRAGQVVEVIGHNALGTALTVLGLSVAPDGMRPGARQVRDGEQRQSDFGGAASN